MTVKELITELNKCNQSDIVMYDLENSYTNAENARSEHSESERDSWECGVDDVAIGSGTLNGFVYLREDLL